MAPSPSPACFLLFLALVGISGARADLCNVFLVGSGLCACYDNDHCAEGKGCLVKNCNKDSCGFPRVCLCKPQGNQEDEQSSCPPVHWGKCDNCYPAETLSDSTTPRIVLVEEYSALPRADLVLRLKMLDLDTEGSDEELVGRLTDFTILQERALSFETVSM